MQTELYLKLAPLILPLIKPKFDQLKAAVGKTAKVIMFEKTFREYLERTLEKNSTITTIACRSNARPFYDLYVPLTLSPTSPTEKPVTLDKFDSSFLVRNGKIFIVDSGGMGKSTCSRWFLLNTLEHTKLIPVLIDLRRLKPEKNIIEYIQAELSSLGKEIDIDLIVTLIGYGDFLFIFDGYDEIGSDDLRGVTRNLKDFIDRAARNYFILTSRPDLSVSAFSNFTHYGIKPLSVAEAHSLLRKYDEGNIAPRLIEELGKTSNQIVSSFLGNPLLVSLLFAAYSYKQAIPFKKSIFFDQVFTALFELHDHTKGDFYRDIKSKLDKAQFQSILSRMAFLSIMKYGKTEYTSIEFNKLVEESIKGSGFSTTTSGVINDLVKAVQLVTQDGIYYRWIHKSIQDYFAAVFLRYEGKDKTAQLITKKILPNVQNYSLMLELFYDLDPKVFRSYCLKPVLENYLKHASKLKFGARTAVEVKEFYTQVSFFSEAIIYSRNAKSYSLSNSENEFVKQLFAEGERIATKSIGGRLSRASYHPIEGLMWLRHFNSNHGLLQLFRNVKIDIFSAASRKTSVNKVAMTPTKIYVISAKKQYGPPFTQAVVANIRSLYSTEREHGDFGILLDIEKVQSLLAKIVAEVEDQGELDKILDGL
ncbi:NACHT domain-containing protein [Bdellovibrio sp. HCB209]|uniref:NACHT domain-containing protein n=1 Tax=Bdellovibrio sp. HCB209 TaxID=3394354 RepID=UPI0039B64460